MSASMRKLVDEYLCWKLPAVAAKPGLDAIQWRDLPLADACLAKDTAYVQLKPAVEDALRMARTEPHVPLLQLPYPPAPQPQPVAPVVPTHSHFADYAASISSSSSSRPVPSVTAQSSLASYQQQQQKVSSTVASSSSSTKRRKIETVISPPVPTSDSSAEYISLQPTDKKSKKKADKAARAAALAAKLQAHDQAPTVQIPPSDLNARRNRFQSVKSADDSDTESL